MSVPQAQLLAHSRQLRKLSSKLPPKNTKKTLTSLEQVTVLLLKGLHEVLSATPYVLICMSLWRGHGSARFGYGLCTGRFERFRFSVWTLPPGEGFSLSFKRCSGFRSCKMVPTVPVLLLVPGKLVFAIPVSGSGSVAGPPWWDWRGCSMSSTCVGPLAGSADLRYTSR